ncbi:unnamed protein product [Arabidopsis halleri]
MTFKFSTTGFFSNPLLLPLNLSSDLLRLIHHRFVLLFSIFLSTPRLHHLLIFDFSVSSILTTRFNIFFRNHHCCFFIC